MPPVARAQTIDLRVREGYEHGAYEHLFELSAMPTLIIDYHARRIGRANRAALEFLGLDAQVVVGMSGPDLLLQPSPDHLTRVRSLRGDETAAIREVPTASGLRTVQLAIVPSGIEGITFVQLDDLTDVLVASARADELARTSEALRTVATRMAHDVSGPLAAMKGFAEHLLRADLDLDTNQRARLLQRIGDGARALVDMTASILSEADTGAARSEDASCRPGDLFSLLRAITDAQLAECGGTLLTRASVEELPVAVGTIRQAMINLVSNSIKYRDPDRRLIIEIDIDATEATTQILVRDNGRGLPADSSGLFESGTRGPDVSHTAGAGLGLAFARTSIERVGGSLQAVPSDGGATLQITLPRAVVVAAAAVATQPSVERTDPVSLTAPQLDRILDESPIATFVIDIALREIVRVNQSGADLLELDATAVVGRPGSDFLDQEAVATSLRRRVIDEPGSVKGLETNLLTAHGPVRARIWIAPVEGTALAVAQVVPIEQSSS